MRLLAAELGEHGVRVNGINPDGVVRGSGIFAGGWGANRAAVYGVEEEDLGAFYAQRTLLKREVLPEHVADAVFVLTGRRPVARPPACTSRSTPASPPPSCDDTRAAGRPSRRSTSGASSGRVIARPRRAGHGCELTEVAPVPQRPGPAARRPALGHPRPLPGRPRRPAGRRAPDRRAGRARDRLVGASTTACSTRTARCSATRATTATRAPSAASTTVHAADAAAELYAVNGLQFICRSTPSTSSPPNADLHARATASLLIPDLLGYWLTGREAAEETNASTTGLLDARTGGWAPELIEALGLPAAAAARRSSPPGEVARRRCRPSCATSSGSDPSRASPRSARTTPPPRSSACPPTGPHFGYISCGTWGLVGVELDAPVLTEDSRRGQLHQRARRRRHHPLPAQRHGAVAAVGVDPVRGTCAVPSSTCAISSAAAAALPPGPRVDPTDPGLPAARRHAGPDRRRPAATRGSGCRGPRPRSSAASSTASRPRSPTRSTRPSGSPASRWRWSTSSAADRRTRCCASSPPTPAGCPWWPGPVEATALGNLLVQARTHGVLAGDLMALRERIRRTVTLTRYEPRAPAR